MKQGVPLLLAVLMLIPAAPAPSGDARVEPLDILVSGQPAHGLQGIPAGEPTALVLILHGYGHNAESHRGHLLALAERGARGIAMDFRGPPTGFPLSNGADDSCAAFLPLVAAYPDAPVILFSVSMGTAVASLVFERCHVFDWWIDSEGLTMLHETWAGATALSPSGNPTAVAAKDAIEAECGGTPAFQPLCYMQRSAALNTGDMTGLRGAWLTHGLNDGLVPYNQGREMSAALRAAGIPSDFYTAIRGEAGGEGTTLTGYLGHNVDGLAGHGSESNDAHTLTALSIGLLYALVDGNLGAPQNREIIVDRDLGTLA